MKKTIAFSVFFLFFSFMNVPCHSDDVINIEALPYLRSGMYNSSPYSRIVVFSAPRTGSSLVYNVLRYLFEKDEKLDHYHDAFDLDCLVLKTHRMEDIEKIKEEKNVLYVIPIRHPLQAIISTYRIYPEPVKNIRGFVEDFTKKHIKYFNFFDKLKQSGHQVVFVRYEDFDNNTDYLFNFVETNFFLSILDSDKDLLRRGYKKENVYASIESFSSFNEFLPQSGFHGKHVILNEYKPPENLTFWINYYFQGVKPLLKRYGY